MNGVKVEWVGWCNEDNHDKVWGYLVHPGKNGWGDTCYRFWAARGKSISFKKDQIGHEISMLVRQKKDKGYRTSSLEEMVKVWPTFENDVETKLCFCLLANSFK